MLLEKVKAHYAQGWGACSTLTTAPEIGVELLLFPANAQRPFHIVASLGFCKHKLSAAAPHQDCQQQEFMFYVPEAMPPDATDPENPVSWLSEFLLGQLRKSVESKQALVPSTLLDTGMPRCIAFFRFPTALVVPPLAESPEFFPLNIDGLVIGFSMLMPLTEKETHFLKQHPLPALMKLMLDKDTLDPCWLPLRECTFKSEAEKQEDALRHEAVDIVFRDEAVREHCTAFFGTPRQDDMFEVPGAETGHRALYLLLFAPTDARPFWTVATSGLSVMDCKTMPPWEEYKNIELLIYLEKEWTPDFQDARCKVLLAVAGELARTGAAGPASVIRNANHEPWAANSSLCSLLLTWPLFEDKTLNSLVDAEVEVRFAQVLLLSRRETEWAEAKGVGELLQLMEHSGTLAQISRLDRPCTFEVVEGKTSAPTAYRLREPELKPVRREPLKSGSPVEPQAQEQMLAAIEKVAAAKMQQGCLLSTAVFVVMCVFLGSNAYDGLRLPAGSGAVIFVLTLVGCAAGPYFYARKKAAAAAAKLAAEQQALNARG